MLMVAAVALALLTWPHPAAASCSCNLPPARILGKAAAIFQGRVLAVASARNIQFDGFIGRDIDVVHFKVLTSWKGLPSQHSAVFHLTDNDCSFDFRRAIGQKLVVFAQPSRQGTWMHWCDLEFGVNHGDAWSQQLERLLPGLAARWNNWHR